MELLNILLGHSKITETNVRLLKFYMEKWDCSPYEALVDSNILSEQLLANTLSAIFKKPRVFSLEGVEIETFIYKKLPYRFAREWNTLPLSQNRETGTYRVLLSDPTNDEILNGLSGYLGEGIDISIGERTFLATSIDERYPISLQVPSLVSENDVN
tara:strand:+ start:357 stop:827 length:471 start_codon:yes stop_codon:yes gene_type:complete